MPSDDAHDWENESALLQAELRRVYAALDHMTAIAGALQAALRGLLEALYVPKAAGGSRDQLDRALREAREAVHQASSHLEAE